MSTASSVPPDFADHIDRLRRLPQHSDETLRALFAPGSPIYIARAPGRLDVMGGIADYSGSLVLEMPIAEAAFAAVQVVKSPSMTIATLPVDIDHTASRPRVKIILPLDWVHLRYEGWHRAHAQLAGDPNSAWAAYIAGAVLVLLRETKSGFDGGLRILIDSRVPEGEGREFVCGN